MTDSDGIQPNRIADTYQSLTEYHELISRLVVAAEANAGETESILHAFADLIDEKRAEFGEATATQNPFTMAEYREAFGDELPTIQTADLTPAEREPLERLGIVSPDETFRILCHPTTGERLPLWPRTDGLEHEFDLLRAFTLPKPSVTLFHISDTHLGYRNRSHPGGGGKTTWVDRTDSILAFKSTLQRAIAEDVDAVVHTGDLFDHDVDRETLEEAVAAIESLTASGIPFYFVLGDHDRLAKGGSIPDAANAVSALEVLSKTNLVTNCRESGTRINQTSVTLFGSDATGIGFEEIRNGYTLGKWSSSELRFEALDNTMTNIICLHEPVAGLNLPALIRAGGGQTAGFDLVLLGHEHRPPFDGAWQTTVDGVTVACAGPTVPISTYFDDYQPGYNLIQIDTDGGISVNRQELPTDSEETIL